MDFSSSVSTSISPSLCVSFSGVAGPGDREGSDGGISVTAGARLDSAISEVGYGGEGSPDVVSELEGCEQADGRICNVVSVATGSEVLIFESGASIVFSLLACLVPT